MGRYDALLEDPKKAPEKVESNHVEKKSPTPVPSTPNIQTIQKPTKPASDSASTLASKHASPLANNDDNVVEHIRKTLKRVGKDVTFVRLTPEEKTQLGDIIYTYKKQGIRTSENEVGRIGLNYLVEDYKTNGDSSVLAKVLAALHT